VNNPACYDPLVLAHARALLTSRPQGRCAYLDADIRDIDTVLTDTELNTVLDLSQPVGIICASVLMLLSDHDDPRKITARLRDWAPAGSHLAISHPTADHNPDAVAAVVSTTREVGLTFVPRTHAQVAELFGDWQLLEPGLVPVLSWRPDHPPPDPTGAYYWAGVARKPSSPVTRDEDTRSLARGGAVGDSDQALDLSDDQNRLDDRR
jgi:hypothetical protein